MPDPLPTSKYQTEDAAAESTPLTSPAAPTLGPPFRRDVEVLPRPFGRYTLQKLLGRGGMGRVYLAHDPQLDRLVALKMPNPVADVDGWRERFLTEARAAATLTHANVCPVHEVGEVDAQPYLTMAYIEGETLAAKLTREGPFVPAKAVELVGTVARAMHEAHRRGIIHRDLKPANLMLDPSGRPVIMDFGLAIRSSNADDLRVTLTGVALGTPAYMPPEQAGGDNDSIGAPADVYALGVILFELVTGRTPFRAKTFGKLLAQIERDPPPAPSSLNPNVDPALEALILTSLAKTPSDRFASAGDLADALERHQQGERDTLTSLYSRPYLTPDATADYRPAATSVLAPPPRSRRRSFLLAGAALLLVSAALGAGIYIETDYGQIVVQLSDPKAKVDVRVNGQEVTLTTEGGKPIRVRAGKNQKLEVSGADFETIADTFDLKRGEIHLARITLKARVALAKKEPEPKVVDPPKKDPVEPPKKDPPPKPVSFPEKPTLIEVAGAQILADASKEEMQKWLDERKKDKHSVFWLDAAQLGNKAVYCAIAKLDDSKANWQAFLDMPVESMRDGQLLKFVGMTTDHPLAYSGYLDGENVKSVSLWRKERLAFYVEPAATPALMKTAEDACRGGGAVFRIIRPYVVGDGVTVAVIGHAAFGQKWTQLLDADDEQLAEFVKTRQDAGERITSFAAYSKDGKLLYAIVGSSNPAKVAWKLDHDLTADQLKSKTAELAKLDFRAQSVTVYPWDGAVRYCVVWVKDKKG